MTHTFKPSIEKRSIQLLLLSGHWIILMSIQVDFPADPLSVQKFLSKKTQYSLHQAKGLSHHGGILFVWHFVLIKNGYY